MIDGMIDLVTNQRNNDNNANSIIKWFVHMTNQFDEVKHWNFLITSLK